MSTEVPSGDSDERTVAPPAWPTLSRRRFLETAAVGAAAFSFGPTVLRRFRPAAAQPLARSLSTDAFNNVYSFQGAALEVSGRRLMVSAGGTVRVVTIGSQSSMWNLGSTSHMPRVGDNVLVRGLIPGQPSDLWTNIISLRGLVTAVSAKEWAVIVGSPGRYHGQTIGVSAARDAVWKSMVPGQPPTASLQVGDAVNVIGGDRGGSVAATMISYLPAGTSLPGNGHVAPQVTQGPDNICYLRWTGHATYFDCPDGAGACGSCNTGSNGQAAWPYVLDHCNYECTSQCALYCGDSFVFYPCAGSSGVGLTVADNGPCQQSRSGCTCSPTVCGQTCNGEPCGLDLSLAVVDLTAPTFARFYSPSQYGCFSCAVAIPIECGTGCPY